MKKYCLFLLFGIATGFFACEEEEPKPIQSTPQPVITPTANTRLLVNKNWKLTSFTKSGVSEDLITGLPACQKDNFYIYTETSKLRVDEGKTTCVPSTAGQGTWAFKDNEKVLNIVVPGLEAYGLSGDFDVDSLGASIILLSKKDGATSYKATFNL